MAHEIYARMSESSLRARPQDLPEAQQPEAILSPLKKYGIPIICQSVLNTDNRCLVYRHQRQALSFLMQRKNGWNFDPRSADFWDLRQTTQSTFFLNRICETFHVEEPPEFCGGIVADPIGLGKTLTMIALVASDRREVIPSPVSAGNTTSGHMVSLILVPPPLLDTWEEQLQQHVRPGGMTWCRYHGKDRINDVSKAANWCGGRKADSSILFSVNWRRIILDEAHMIHNTQSQMSKAVCALEATARWAVTGTPIQNKIGDIAALLKCLRVHPYDDAKRFEADIRQLALEEWRHRRGGKKTAETVERPNPTAAKTVVDLPPRRYLKFPVEFSLAERQFYDKLRHQVIARIEDAFGDVDGHGGAGSASSHSYVTVIQRINALRMVCNLGTHYDSRHDLSMTKDSAEYSKDWSSAIAQQAFNIQREMGPVLCSICRASDCDMGTASLEAESTTVQPFFARCMSFVCGDCVQRCNRLNKLITCGHTPAHPITEVSASLKALEEGLGTLEDADVPPPSFISSAFSPSASQQQQQQLSSKVTALISQLSALPRDVKSVVFASWRMTLDLVEVGLSQTGIRYVRFDGKVQQKQRHAIIEKFRKDPTVTVFLLTLSCGAVGLTLAEASRAFLIEPHGNPTVEEQALARIHRLGQRREVTTVRFFVRDTFEERVLDLQNNKKKLEEVLLAATSRKEGGERVMVSVVLRWQ
ncbi:P-loop containing nucleoside triphosphate hydrolase protein [Apodospora peruviana]|uniref:P-loop containing nucleoside triphosphate hydrolase protein n=1 Tax=Apodospora peruviana TaxID=516989 RepID=A0AAE0IUK9_9PEZI|nr:P-loop containing nucleoside triphosphate hydrolase protein [Apodospora peruviana]